MIKKQFLKMYIGKSILNYFNFPVHSENIEIQWVSQRGTRPDAILIC